MPGAATEQKVGTGTGKDGSERVIHRYVVLGHPLRGEALLETRADHAAIEPVQVGHGGARPGNVVDDEPVQPWSSTSGTEPRRYPITGVPQAIASIITSPGLRPVDREQESQSVAQEGRLVPIADLADVLDQWVAQQGRITSSK